jgi:hypothetical protein
MLIMLTHPGGSGGEGGRQNGPFVSDTDVRLKLNKRDNRAIWAFEIQGKVRYINPGHADPRRAPLATPLISCMRWLCTSSRPGDRRNLTSRCARHQM